MGKRAHSEDVEDEDFEYPREQSEENADDSREASPPQNKRPKKAPASKPAEKENGDKKTKKGKSDDAEGSAASKGKKGSSAKNVFTNADGEKYVDLGNKRRATVRRFKGSILIDIREFYGNEDDLKPGKKGISLSADQWSELKANASTIEQLIKKV